MAGAQKVPAACYAPVPVFLASISDRYVVCELLPLNAFDNSSYALAHSDAHGHQRETALRIF